MAFNDKPNPAKPIPVRWDDGSDVADEVLVELAAESLQAEYVCRECSRMVRASELKPVPVAALGLEVTCPECAAKLDWPGDECSALRLRREGRHITIQTTEARAGFNQLVQRLFWGKLDRVDITYRGKPAAVLCSRELLCESASTGQPADRCPECRGPSSGGGPCAFCVRRDELCASTKSDQRPE